MFTQKNNQHLFFFASAQSSLGTFLAYVPLVILLNERLHSPVKLSVILLAEFMPAVCLGAFIGHLIDRQSKRAAAVLGDILCATAFIGLAVFQSFTLMLIFALLGGLGIALRVPAVQAGLPNLGSKDETAKLFATQVTLNSLATVAGPVLAGILLTHMRPEPLLIINAVSFGISAVLFALLPLDGTQSDTSNHRQVSFTRSLQLPRPFWLLLSSNGLLTLFGSMIGIAEIYFALNTLHLHSSGLAILIAAYGLGMAVGNAFSGTRRLSYHPFRTFLAGVILFAVGLLMMATIHGAVLAYVLYALTGVGNGVVLVNIRILILNAVVPERHGLAYGLKDTVDSLGFTIAYLTAGFIVSQSSPRAVFAVAGCGAVVALLVALLTPNRWYNTLS